MKHVLSLALVAGILGFSTPYLRPAEGQRIGFLVNLGFMTKEGVSPNWLTLGPELMIPLGTRLSFNSRIALIVIPLSERDYVSFGLALGMGF